MQAKKSLTKKEIDQFCRTVIYLLIDSYDVFAFNETFDLSEKEIDAILAKMKFYASKFETDHIMYGDTNSILNSVRKNIADLKADVEKAG